MTKVAAVDSKSSRKRGCKYPCPFYYIKLYTIGEFTLLLDLYWIQFMMKL